MYRNQTPNQLTTADFSCIFPVFQTFSCKFWLKLLPFARLWSDSNEIQALSFFRRAGLNRAVIFWFFSTNHSTANHISLKLLPFPCFCSDFNEIRNLSFFCQVPLNRAVVFWFFSTNQPITAQPITFSLNLLPFPCFRSDFNEIWNLSFFRRAGLNRAVCFLRFPIGNGSKLI